MLARSGHEGRASPSASRRSPRSRSPVRTTRRWQPPQQAQPPRRRTSAAKRSYNMACVACHGAGVAGAPKFGDKAAWAPRIAKGADTLHEHAIEGFQGTAGFMPAEGRPHGPLRQVDHERRRLHGRRREEVKLVGRSSSLRPHRAACAAGFSLTSSCPAPATPAPRATWRASIGSACARSAIVRATFKHAVIRARRQAERRGRAIQQCARVAGRAQKRSTALLSSRAFSVALTFDLPLSCTRRRALQRLRSISISF